MSYDLEKLSQRLKDEKGLDIPATNPHILSICQSLDMISKLKGAIQYKCYTTAAGKKSFYLEVPFEGVCGRNSSFWTPKVGEPKDAGKAVDEKVKDKLKASLVAFRVQLEALEAMLDEPLPEWVEKDKGE